MFVCNVIVFKCIVMNKRVGVCVYNNVYVRILYGRESISQFKCLQLFIILLKIHVDNEYEDLTMCCIKNIVIMHTNENHLLDTCVCRSKRCNCICTGTQPSRVCGCGYLQ